MLQLWNANERQVYVTLIFLNSFSLGEKYQEDEGLRLWDDFL